MEFVTFLCHQKVSEQFYVTTLSLLSASCPGRKALQDQHWPVGNITFILSISNVLDKWKDFLNFGRSSVNRTSEVGVRGVWFVQATHLENVSSWRVLGSDLCRKGWRKRMGATDHWTGQNNSLSLLRILSWSDWMGFGGSGSPAACLVLPWTVRRVEQALVFDFGICRTGLGLKVRSCVQCKALETAVLFVSKTENSGLFWEAAALGYSHCAPDKCCTFSSHQKCNCLSIVTVLCLFLICPVLQDDTVSHFEILITKLGP